MIKCLIVDDEPLAAALLVEYASKIDALEIVKVLENPLEVLDVLKQQKIDLIFLDIQMPQLTGLQLKNIISPDIEVIFTTAYVEHAIKGFELNATDYLLKPITFERFLKATDKVLKMNLSNEIMSEKDFIFIKEEYRLRKILFSDILYLKGLGDYVAIVTKEGKVLTLENMKHFEQVLPTNLFVRAHKSFIVAIKQIDFIEKNHVVIGKEYIPIGATYKDKVLSKLK